MTIEEVPGPDGLLKPGVGNAYRHGWRRLWKNFGDLLLAGIVFFVMTMVIGLIVGAVFSIGWSSSFSSGLSAFGLSGNMTTFAWHFQIVSSILEVFYYTPLLWGLLFLFLCAAAGRRPELAGLFTGFKHRYLRVVETSLLWWLVLSLPSLLILWLGGLNATLGGFLSAVWFFVSIVLYSRLIFVPFLVTDRGLAAGDAFRTSWELSRGHAMENFLIFLLGILVMIGGLIVFLVGVIPAAMWVATALASQYYAVSLEKENPVVSPDTMLT